MMNKLQAYGIWNMETPIDLNAYVMNFSNFRNDEVKIISKKKLLL